MVYLLRIVFVIVIVCLLVRNLFRTEPQEPKQETKSN